jgi:glycosyltransferase involved in cell wall biosynthesis
MVPAQSNPYGELLADAIRAQGIEVVAGQGPRRFPVLPLVLAWLRAGRPGVLHLHWTHRYLRPQYGSRSLGRRRTGLELRLLRRLGVRLVWTIHNVSGHESGDAEERRAHAMIAALCDAIVCHCEAARQLAAEAYSLDAATRARMHVIPHGSYAGVYPDTFRRDQAREALGLAPGAVVLLFLGQIRPYKGVAGLLEAFRAVTHPDARLVVAGRIDDVDLRASLVAEASADPRVLLLPGEVPDDRMQVFLRAADAMVLPYRDVLTSGSAILGMTFGLPVVAPAIGCLPETLEGCSVLYDPERPDGLRGALEAALGADLRALGARAASTAASLGWGPIGARTAALYRGEAGALQSGPAIP